MNVVPLPIALNCAAACTLTKPMILACLSSSAKAQSLPEGACEAVTGRAAQELVADRLQLLDNLIEPVKCA